MKRSLTHKARLAAFLFALGLAGVLSALPLIPKLIELSGKAPPISIAALQLLSTLQSSVLLAGSVILGIAFAGKVGLRAPLLEALAQREATVPRIKPIFVSAILWGAASGAFLSLFSTVFARILPPEFLVSAARLDPPWYTRLLYGGITEEILMRWGVMSFFTWASSRLTQRSGKPVRPIDYMIGATIAALLFGIGHLPAAKMLAGELAPSLIAYIVIGNASFGLVAGYLFRRHGLEAAIIAHMTVHVALIAAAKIAL